MIGRLNHVAIVVPDLAAASRQYRDVLGAQVSEPADLPEHGVTVVFVELGNTKIELLHPLGEESPIAAYLARSAAVDAADVRATVNRWLPAGRRVELVVEPEPVQ